MRLTESIQPKQDPVDKGREGASLVKDRKRFGLCLLITVVVGAVFFLMRGTTVDSIANHATGSLYVLAWIFFILMLSPRFTPLKVCVLVLLGTCALEVLQLWHPPILEAVRSTLPGRLLLGTTFVWSDFPAYGVGAFIGWVIATKITAGTTQKGLSSNVDG